MAAKTEKLTDVGLLVNRLGLGLIVLYYGSQMALGVFGGDGFQAQLVSFEENLGAPRWLGALAIISAFAGSIGILLGLFTRLSAFGICCTMAVATYTGLSRPGSADALVSGDMSTLPQFYYPMALAFMALAITLTGAGSFSIDKKLFGKGR